ncbi:hypothetical protein HMI54_010523, partial [Coelomomyces lativittatus]
SLFIYSLNNSACSNDKVKANELLTKPYNELISSSSDGSPNFNGPADQCIAGDLVQGNQFCGYATSELACQNNCSTVDCSIGPSTRIAPLPTSAFNNSDRQGSTLKTVGIVVGGLVGVGAFGFLGFLLYRRRKQYPTKFSLKSLTKSPSLGSLSKKNEQATYAPPRRQASMLYGSSPESVNYPTRKTLIQQSPSANVQPLMLLPLPRTFTSPTRSLKSRMSTVTPTDLAKMFQPGDKCVAEDEFNPVVDDEVTLKPGDRVEVLSIYDDGWGHVQILESMLHGMVPLIVLKKEAMDA